MKRCRIILMKIVPEIFEKIELAHSSVVVITKYFDGPQTESVLMQLQTYPSFIAIGENRIGDIMAKNIPRERVHFIGNIQSRNIPDIAKHCVVIHSLCEVSHGEKLNAMEEPIQVFIQINISQEPQKSGVLPEDLPDFLKHMESFSNIEILGISAMGAGGFLEETKRAEFVELKRLRDTYLPAGKISAGTSRDFEIALKEGIEIVRVGRAIFDL